MDRRARREQMRGWIELGRREGLTCRALSQRSGLSLKTLYRWSSRFRPAAQSDEGSARAAPSPRPFVELVEAPPAQREARTTALIEVVLPGERRVRVCGEFDEAQLMRVVRALERC